jgi:NAD-dependent deacetylase
MTKESDIKKVINAIKKAHNIIALTGAGISVESGIATFRGKGGLWEKYDPEEYSHVVSFLKNPDKSWIMLKEMGEQIFQASPNNAHASLTTLQKMGRLKDIITQNVDNLHQEAGSTNVIDFHGNYKTLRCMSCQKEYPFEKERLDAIPPVPRCTCHNVLKPNVVLFGETPPEQALIKSEQAAMNCDMMLVIGTSWLIYPAANLPVIAKKHHAKIVEINTEPTEMTNYLSDYFLQGSAGHILSSIIQNYDDS